MSLDIFPEAAAFENFSQAVGLATLQAANRKGFLKLSDLLLQTRSCKATDPRDKVFSMLGLVDPKLYELKPDYRLSTAEVFKEAVFSIITKTKRLDILSAAQNLDGIEGLPSWAPNFTDEWKAQPFDAENNRSGYKTGHSAGQPKAEVQFDESKSVMTVKGSTVATIESISPDFFTEGETLEKADGVWQKWRSFAATAVSHPHIDYYHKNRTEKLVKNSSENAWAEFLSIGDETIPRYWYTPDGDLIPNNTISIKNLEYQEQAKCLLWTDEAEKLVNPHRVIYSSIQRYGPGRRLTCSTTGILALAPAEVQPGDIICLLHGTSFPYVLRPKEGKYLVVGEACKWS